MKTKMHPKDDKVLNAAQWQVEAESIINDVRDHVRDLRISSTLPSSNSSIYLNLTTLEGMDYCVNLSAQGFSIVGNTHDSSDIEDPEYYETIYGLLDCISPQYRMSFGRGLFDKLQELSDSQNGER